MTDWPMSVGEWEHWCEYTSALSLAERGKADAAISDLKAMVEDLDAGYDAANAVAVDRAEKAEAERDTAVRDFAAKVREVVENWRRRDYESETICVYCHASTNFDNDIVHKDDCLYIAILDALTPKEET